MNRSVGVFLFLGGLRVARQSVTPSLRMPLEHGAWGILNRKLRTTKSPSFGVAAAGADGSCGSAPAAGGECSR